MSTQDPGPAAAPAASPEGAALHRGEGQAHALVLTLALVLPLAGVVVQTAAAEVAGFPRVLTLLATVVVAVVGILLLPDSQSLTLPRVAARLTGLAMLALAVRFSTPSPMAAWADYRAGGESLASSRLLVPMLLFLVAFVAAQVIGNRVVAAIVGTRAANADRGRETTALQVWLGATALFLLAAPSPAGRTPWVAVGLVLGPVLALFVLGDLRTRLRGPDSDRPLQRGGRRRTVSTTLSVALAATLVLGAAGAGLLPAGAMAGLGRPSEWVGNAFDWDFRQRTGERDGVVGGGTHAERDGEEGESGLRVPNDNLFANVADPPWWVVSLLVALLGWVVLRPRQWRALLARLWRLLRGVLGLGDGDAEADVESWHGDDPIGRGTSRLRQTLQRLLPRPRDPRQAIIHDYLRLDRTLLRENDDDHAMARERWETPLEHAQRITLGEAHAELAALTSMARFARQPPTDADARRSLELRQAVERLVRDTGADGQPPRGRPSDGPPSGGRPSGGDEAPVV